MLCATKKLPFPQKRQSFPASAFPSGFRIFGRIIGGKSHCDGVGSEAIETILADGTRETTNTANAGDWIVTNPGGEQYIVPSAKFPKKYEPAPELGDGWFKPTGGVQKFLELSEDTSFVCSWNEEQFIAAGGMINVTCLDDIYGIARQEFFDTYKECDEDGSFI